jgi:ADP-heptose:LPS heptosyltransferase
MSPAESRPQLRQARLALLRLAARLAPARPGPVPTATPQSVLLIRPDHVGDLLFTAPAIHFLRLSWPKTKITLLVGPWSRPAAAGIPHVDAILTTPFPYFSRQPRRWLLEPYLQLLNEAQALAAYRFDLAVILRFDHWWGAWLAQQAGIPRRIGYSRPEVAPFLSRAVPYVAGQHEVEQNLRLIEAAVGRTNPGVASDLNFEPSDQDEQAADRLLAEQGVRPGDVLACVHPGSGAPVKLWRNEGWAQVIEVLVKDMGVRVLVTGGPNERVLTQDLVRRLTVPVIDLTGKTELGQLGAVMGRCRLALGVDSGPLHLAVAMGAPTVHLFGPVATQTFGPWGEPALHAVVTSDRACMPCNRLDACPEGSPTSGLCMLDIRVPQVTEAARRVMEATAKDGN